MKKIAFAALFVGAASIGLMACGGDDDSGDITFADTDRLSDQFAVYLREVAGFKPGDRVAIQMPNCLAYPIAVFGTLKAGLVMANTNPLYTTAEMLHQFNDSGAVGLIAIDLFATKVAEVLPKTGIKTVIVVGISDLLPPLKRLVIRTVEKYVKKMIPPISLFIFFFQPAPIMKLRRTPRRPWNPVWLSDRRVPCGTGVGDFEPTRLGNFSTDPSCELHASSSAAATTPVNEQIRKLRIK